MNAKNSVKIFMTQSLFFNCASDQLAGYPAERGFRWTSVGRRLNNLTQANADPTADTVSMQNFAG